MSSWEISSRVWAGGGWAGAAEECIWASRNYKSNRCMHRDDVSILEWYLGNWFSEREVTKRSYRHKYYTVASVCVCLGGGLEEIREGELNWCVIY